MNQMCFACGCEKEVTRVANYFIPGEGNFSVWKCTACGDIWFIPIYDVNDTEEFAVLEIN